jgi:predicted RNase H-like HicB family nuclease
MKPRAKYSVSYTRDTESGWWVAEVGEAKGCVTQGRTIKQAQERIREALQAWLDLPKPYAGEIVGVVLLPAAERLAVAEAIAASNKARKAAVDSSRKTRQAVERLVAKGLSLRDAGELLGLSRQRAQQLLTG